MLTMLTKTSLVWWGTSLPMYCSPPRFRPTLRSWCVVPRSCREGHRRCHLDECWKIFFAPGFWYGFWIESRNIVVARVVESSIVGMILCHHARCWSNDLHSAYLRLINLNQTWQWKTQIFMEHCPLKHIYREFQTAMFDYQRVVVNDLTVTYFTSGASLRYLDARNAHSGSVEWAHHCCRCHVGLVLR